MTSDDPFVDKMHEQLDEIIENQISDARAMLRARGATDEEADAMIERYRNQLALWRTLNMPAAEAWVRRRGAPEH